MIKSLSLRPTVEQERHNFTNAKGLENAFKLLTQGLVVFRTLYEKENNLPDREHVRRESSDSSNAECRQQVRRRRPNAREGQLELRLRRWEIRLPTFSQLLLLNPDISRWYGGDRPENDRHPQRYKVRFSVVVVICDRLSLRKPVDNKQGVRDLLILT